MRSAFVLAVAGLLGCGESKEGHQCRPVPMATPCASSTTGGTLDGMPIDLARSHICLGSNNARVTGCALPGGGVCVDTCALQVTSTR